MDKNQIQSLLLVGHFRSTDDAYVFALKKLLNKKYRIKKDKILAETRAAFVVTSNQRKSIIFGDKFEIVRDYGEFGDSHNKQILHENKHYYSAFIKSKKFEKAIKILLKDPTSKKAIIDLNETPKPKDGTPCLVYLFFRIINGKLNLYCHMRANNAYLKHLFNLDINQAVHRKAAEILNVKLGSYYHFVDSLHIYRREIALVKKYIKEIA